MRNEERSLIWRDMSDWFLRGGDCEVVEDAGMVIMWLPHCEGCEYGYVTVAYCSYNEMFDREIGMRVALSKQFAELGMSMPIPADWETKHWARAFADLCCRSNTFSE